MQRASRCTGQQSYNIDPALLIEQEDPHPYWHDLWPSWHSQALCNEGPQQDDVFFGKGDFETRPPLSVAEIRKAQDICFRCPVFVECLSHSLVRKEKYGIWAGTSRRTRVKAWTLLDLGKATLSEIVEQFCLARDEIKRKRGNE